MKQHDLIQVDKYVRLLHTDRTTKVRVSFVVKTDFDWVRAIALQTRQPTLDQLQPFVIASIKCIAQQEGERVSSDPTPGTATIYTEAESLICVRNGGGDGGKMVIVA